MEHAELVAEMPHVERLSTQERLNLARRRRLQQLKVWTQREKEWSRHYRNAKDRRRRVYFSNSVMLLEAASRNDVEEVKRLLMSGVDPDSTNEDGLTALHQCCIDDNEEMLQLLLDFGANPNAEDSEKWTPLHAAATCAHLHLVRYLISKGANLLAVNADGNMPYDICEDESALDYIEGEMARRGVTQDLIDETRAATEMTMLNEVQEAVARGVDLDVADSQGATPLHVAAANGYLRVVEYLLDQNVCIDARDFDDWQPVHAAACWGHLEVVEMLVHSGADLNARTRHEETPADICEDPELRERIVALRSEQESRRQDQRRKVRRSQSNNTRTQSVRRTSIRDKSLTSKKDAVEEARLRLTLTPDVSMEPANGGQTVCSIIGKDDKQIDESVAVEVPPPAPRIDPVEIREPPSLPSPTNERLDPDGRDKEDGPTEFIDEPGELVVPAETSYVTSDAANGKININVTVTISTLADLKKQRAQNRGLADGGGLSPRSSITSDRSPEMVMAPSPPVQKFAGPTAEMVPDVRTRSCCVIA